MTRASYPLAIIEKEEFIWQMNKVAFVFGDYSYPFNESNITLVNQTLINTTLEFTTQITSSHFPNEYVDVFLKYFPSGCRRVPLDENSDLIYCPNINLVSDFYLDLNNSLKKINKFYFGIDVFWNYHILFNHDENIVIFYPLNNGKLLC